jgi:hypothetical protein
MYISEKNMQGIPKEGTCSICKKPCKTSTASVQFIHQECYDLEFEKDTGNSILRGVAIFNKYAPDWRKKARDHFPCRPINLISYAFGSSEEAKRQIPELARACSAGRRNRGGRGEQDAQEAFFSGMGLLLEDDELDRYDLLSKMWEKAIEDPDLFDLLPPPHRAHFVQGKNGGSICYWYGNLIGFPDRSGPQPKAGECWEVLDGMKSPFGHVFFLKLGERIEEEQDIWRHWM